MPIYEFVCEDCNERFEGLFAVGTDLAQCPQCGSERSRRLLSTPGAPLHLVKPPGEVRRQELRNARLRKKSRAEFKAARKRARETQASKRAREGGTGPSGGGA